MVWGSGVRGKEDVVEGGKRGERVKMGMVGVESDGMCKEEKIMNLGVENGGGDLVVRG